MDHTDDFYLVLPSNSSLSYFPDNATTCYTTHLSRELRLTGDWLVGLAEIQIPSTVIHIEENEAYYNFILGDEHEIPDRDICNFPRGVYESVEQLANEINKVKDVRNHQLLVPADSQKGYYMLKRTCDCPQPHYTKFNEKLRRIFGFETDAQRQSEFIATSNAGLAPTVANRPASLARAIPDMLYVYTDVCEPYNVGDTQAALLRIVAFENTKYKFGANIVKQFAPIHYIPLLHHSFQNIIIDIRDQHGRNILFTYGTLTVSLHFKRIR